MKLPTSFRFAFEAASKKLDPSALRRIIKRTQEIVSPPGGANIPSYALWARGEQGGNAIRAEVFSGEGVPLEAFSDAGAALRAVEVARFV